MKYLTPAGTVQKLYLDALEQAHLLIAGQTGSGKSVVLNGIIQAALHFAPSEKQFILIDPKRVELIDYKPFPHTITYASEPADMIKALENAMQIIDERYREMQEQRRKKYDGAHIYVIIDELADLMSLDAKHAAPLLTRIGQVGRAAGVHLIVCTQHLVSSGANIGGIPTQIKVNLSAVIGLHTRNSRDSRTIIGESGCEKLPQHGECIYITPGQPAQHLKIPYAGDEAAQAETERLLKWWTGPDSRINTRLTVAQYNALTPREQKRIRNEDSRKKAVKSWWQGRRKGVK